MKVALIGAGNMGGALARAIVETNIVTPSELLIVEANETRREELKNLLGCNSADSIDERLSEYQIVILAIKPQGLSSVSTILGKVMSESQVLVSILAGVTIDSLQDALGGHGKVARVMPNTPVQVGKGVSVYMLSSSVTAKEASFLQDALSASGLALQVQDEALMDAATAACASGVGFVYYLIEHFMHACTALGFSEDQSEDLIRETFAGGIDLWRSSGKSVAELREAVTSKGGTTEAGLSALNQERIGEGLSAAIRAACERAKELSQS